MNSFLPSQLKHEKYGPYAGAVAAAAVLYSTARLLAGSGKTQKDGLKQIPVPGSSYPYIGKYNNLHKMYP
jgi:hypothetical protein